MTIQPLDGSLASALPFSAAGEEAGSPLTSGFAAGSPASDAISRIVPPWMTDTMSNPGQTAMLGPLPGLLQQLMQVLQQLMGSLGGTQYPGPGQGAPYGRDPNCPPYGGNSNCPPYGGERYFQNADGASVGDPHLSFNGQKWNSMVSQPDLLESNSIPGGFRVSTQVTQPNQRGVTRNQSATIALNNGATTVSLDNCGRASIESYGRNIPISAGQTVRLGDGSSVTCGQNGQLTVTSRNQQGGEITTTLGVKGQGVDVDVSAHDVDLGGTLVNRERLYPGPGPQPVPSPIPSPYHPPVDNPPIQMYPDEQTSQQTQSYFNGD